MLGCIGKRLLKDMVKRVHLFAFQPGNFFRRPLEIHFDHGIGSKFPDQTLHAFEQIAVAQLPRTQVENVGADIRYG